MARIFNSGQIGTGSVGNTHDTSPNRKDSAQQLKSALRERETLYRNNPSIIDQQTAYQRTLLLPDQHDRTASLERAIKCHTAKTALDDAWRKNGIDYPSRILLMEHVEQTALAEITTLDGNATNPVESLLRQQTPPQRLNSKRLYKYVQADEPLRNAIADFHNCPDDPTERNVRLTAISKRLVQLGAGEMVAQQMANEISNVRARAAGVVIAK